MAAWQSIDNLASIWCKRNLAQNQPVSAQHLQRLTTTQILRTRPESWCKLKNAEATFPHRSCVLCILSQTTPSTPFDECVADSKSNFCGTDAETASLPSMDYKNLNAYVRVSRRMGFLDSLRRCSLYSH